MKISPKFDNLPYYENYQHSDPSAQGKRIRVLECKKSCLDCRSQLQDAYTDFSSDSSEYFYQR